MKIYRKKLKVEEEVVNITKSEDNSTSTVNSTNGTNETGVNGTNESSTINETEPTTLRILQYEDEEYIQINDESEHYSFDNFSSGFPSDLLIEVNFIDDMGNIVSSISDNILQIEFAGVEYDDIEEVADNSTNTTLNETNSTDESLNDSNITNETEPAAIRLLEEPSNSSELDETSENTTNTTELGDDTEANTTDSVNETDAPVVVNYTRQFLGRKSFSIINGSVKIVDLNIAERPLKKFKIVIFSSEISYNNKTNYTKHEINHEGYYGLLFDITLRDCLPGEVPQDFATYGVCKKCDIGKYSFEPSMKC